MFPEGYVNETQITATVLSMDREASPEIAALFGSSLWSLCARWYAEECVKKKNCKPYERLNLRLNECEQVCTKNLIFDRKTKKCVRQRDLCKPYQLYNITTKNVKKFIKQMKNIM